jgi:flagellar FliL protein
MAQEDDLDLDMEDGEEVPKSKSKLLIIIIVVVLLLGVSATATLMFTGILSGDEEVVAEESESVSKSDKKKTKVKKSKARINYVPLDPPFVVNFSADTDIRFLQLTLQVGTRDPSVVELVKEHRPAIRNSLVFLFGSQDPYALNTREGKEALREQTLAEIQKVMKSETGSAGVESVFFTSFVMQ